jgi:hypothetical protein
VQMEQLNKVLSPDNDRWLRQYIDTHGRAPAILLIGNIANNGYNNAKLLLEAGLDCDVISYDYYHMMGCPEWEDADLSGRLNDDFRPNWSSMDLGGFETPEWFAQGPLKMCIDYLCARRGKAPKKHKYRKRILIESKRISPTSIEYLLSLIEPMKIVKKIYRRLSKASPRFERLANRVFDKYSSTAAIHDQAFKCRADALVTEFTRQFPERSDKLEIEDLIPYSYMFSEWNRLFNHYDIIIGFATDPFLPLLSGRSYFAIEHGTLRTIPFEKNGQGRRTALAYNQAQHFFVTNFDCVGSAEKLAPFRFSLMNHPYDEDRGLIISGVTQIRDQLFKELDADFLIFHPTRHDWVEGTGFADKKNEVILLSFAELRARGWRVGLVVCEWGSNVSQSKHLIHSQGCNRHVKWIKPLAIRPFERICRACDVVADQFKLGSFGGVVFKAMATGAPVLTYLNYEQLKKQYSECPPVINCTSSDEVCVQLTELLKDRNLLKVLSEKTLHWIKRFHGKKETINAQVDQFRLHHPVLKQTIQSKSL